MSNYKITVLRGRDLPACHHDGSADPYITLNINGKEEAKTKKIKKTFEPIWNESFTLSNVSDSSVISLDCVDANNIRKDEKLGNFSIPATDLVASRQAPLEKWYPVLAKKHHDERCGDILLKIEYSGDISEAEVLPVPLTQQPVVRDPNAVTHYPGEVHGIPSHNRELYPHNAVQPAQSLGYTTVFSVPRIFIMRQRFWKGDMSIYDEHGNKVLFADQKTFSWGHNLKIYAPGDLLVGQVKQKVKLGMPTFKLLVNDQKVAMIKQKFSLKHKFHVTMLDPKYGLDLDINGDFIGYDLQIYRGDRVVATVSKKFFASRDTYGVEVLPGR
jgi:uncharacterized protein YxjI